MQFFRTNVLSSFDSTTFKNRGPFPFHGFDQLLTEEAFDALYKTFPSVNFFEKHMGVNRYNGQRSHDRYYLAYESTVYTQISREDASRGTIGHKELPPVWQDFIEEIRSNNDYKTMIYESLGTDKLVPRFAWHMGYTSTDVSPHIDAREKVGTHIFYFNRKPDWDVSWGGEILVLGGCKKSAENPEISDFSEVIPVPIVDNSSFLFANRGEAWHSVAPLKCPPNHYRRLFNCIYESKEAAELRGKKKRTFTQKMMSFLKR